MVLCNTGRLLELVKYCCGSWRTGAGNNSIGDIDLASVLIFFTGGDPFTGEGESALLVLSERCTLTVALDTVISGSLLYSLLYWSVASLYFDG